MNIKSRRKQVILILAFGAGLALIWLYTIFGDLPRIDSISANLTTPSVRITDRNGRPLYELLPPSGGRNAVLPIESIPQCMIDATIAVEDQNFYQNPGVDLAGILRAFWINLRGGETLAGGSTITQQVARNLLLGPDERTERTLRRKLREAWLAWQLSRRLPKDQILALYLNQTYYGGLAYGVEAASQTYFGKSASELILPECALLAGLPQAPSLYDPYVSPELARQRQLIVLGLMEEQGLISAEERQQAEEFLLQYNPAPYPILAPHFIWMVKSALDGLFADGRLDPHLGLVVRTTLDLDDQQIAEAAIARTLAKFANQSTTLDPNVNNAALVAMDPVTGEVLALVGSADYFDNSIHGAVNMATASRQPGSAFKPFIYALALNPDQAAPWTAATTILDVDTTFIDEEGNPFTPRNYDEREHGPVSVRQALGSSLNIPAVITLDHVGTQAVTNLGQQMGILSLNQQQQYHLAMALGGGEMSLLELTGAYATLANQGKYPGHTIILDVRDPSGNLLYQTEHLPQPQVIDPRVAWLITDILSDDQARSIGFGLNSTLKLDRSAAVKTGTTTNYHDNWTVGYTPDLVVGVWVGNAGYEAMRNVTGLTGAAPIWNETMRTILQGRPERPFVRPDGLVQVSVCDLSGLLATPACQHTRLEWFIDGTQPTQTDDVYHQVLVDSATGLLADPSTPPARQIPMVLLDLPIRAIPWARSRGLLLLVDHMPAGRAASDETPIALIQPQPNTTYRLAAGFDQNAQQLPVEAVAAEGVNQISIWVDNTLLESFSAAPYRTWWPLSLGEHRFHAEGLSADGERFSSEVITIVVVP
jgi:penicillin-binding protein 1C